MSTPERAGIAGKRCDGTLDHNVVRHLRLLEGDVELVTADEPNSQHNARHLRSLCRTHPPTCPLEPDGAKLTVWLNLFA